jgi:hypothetical protein
MLNKTFSFEKRFDVTDFLPESQEILKDYICHLCKGVLNDPVIDSCTHCHVYCRSCIEKSLKQSKACPVETNNVIDEKALHPIKFVVNILEKQSIYCTNKNRNCKWSGKFSALDDHLNTNCQKNPVKCKNSGCEDIVLREQFENHFRSCQYRSISCADCNASIPYIFQKHHVNDCPKFKILCSG